MYVESIRVFGREFSCRVCGLYLEDRDLELAGMDGFKLADGEFDIEMARRAFEEQLYDGSDDDY